MIWHNATPDEVLTELDVDKEHGLTEKEAEKRLLEFGENLSILDNDLSIFKALTAQLKKPSTIILLCLLVIFVLRELVIGTNRFWIPAGVLLLLAIKEAIFIYSEYKSVNMLFRLKNRIDTSAKVLRDGVWKIINASQIVPGDIIELQEGDFVPADARLIDSFALRCDEATLYNEKEVVAVGKNYNDIIEDHRPINERSNMIYCSSHVMSGNAIAVVTETGENAELRRQFKKNRVFTHKGVQDRIADRFSSFLKIFTISAFAALCILTILGTFAVSGNIGWGKFLEALIVAVCFYVTVVPENLSAQIALMLSLGVKRLEKDRAQIFNPSTVEKLAGVTVICADKTGTLTQNRMVLREVFDGEKVINLSSDAISKQCEVAMRFGSLSCDVVDNEILDHTEAALVSGASRYLNISKIDFDREFPRVACIPLTPERIIKTTVNMIEGKVFAIVRGAPDIILERCVNINSEEITEAYKNMCNKGLRVLAISYKVLSDIPTELNEAEIENELEFLGLLGLSDRERKGTSDEIALCREAGISTVMFTGDHINTASSVAEKMGIVKGDELAITGDKLDGLTDEELALVVNKVRVCARISPEQRVRMVNALHENGETVLITADSSANHAPMAFADVGCAMGKTGTDVAKGNADVIVEDDRFISIVRAIKNSRGIFANFTKYAEYYVTMCCCLFMSVALCMILFGTPLMSAQLLLLFSTFTLMFPILALGYETADNSTMKAPPWNIGSKMFDVKRLLIAAAIGVGISIPSGIVYFINQGEDCAASAAFTAMIFSLVYYMFSFRSNELFYKRILHNRFLLIISAIFIAITLIITGTPIAYMFALTPMCLKGFITSILLPLTGLLIFETIKAIKPIINNK